MQPARPAAGSEEFFSAPAPLPPSTMLLSLPEETWRSVALHLAAPDVLSLLSVHRSVRRTLSSSESFWSTLLARDSFGGHVDGAASAANNGSEDGGGVEGARGRFMLQSYKSALPRVRWLPLDCPDFPVTPREGHVSW